MTSQDQQALALIFARNVFFRRLHYLALAAVALSVMVIILLIWMLIFLLQNPSKPLYFAADNVSRLIKVIPVNQPNMTLEQTVAWSIEALEAAYSYDFVNYRMQLQNAQNYFMNYGWRTYMDALTDSNNLLALTQRNMVVIAKVIDQPKIITQGLLGGAYAWKFEMPVLMTYMLPPYDDKSRFSNALSVVIVVQRQPLLQSYKGLGIVQVIGTMAAASDQLPAISTTPTDGS